MTFPAATAAGQTHNENGTDFETVQRSAGFFVWKKKAVTASSQTTQDTAIAERLQFDDSAPVALTDTPPDKYAVRRTAGGGLAIAKGDLSGYDEIQLGEDAPAGGRYVGDAANMAALPSDFNGGPLAVNDKAFLTATDGAENTGWKNWTGAVWITHRDDVDTPPPTYRTDIPDAATATNTDAPGTKAVRDELDLLIPRADLLPSVRAAGSTEAKPVDETAIRAAIDAITIGSWRTPADIADSAALAAITDHKLNEKVRVLDDGDGKFAIYSSRSEAPAAADWMKLADEDNLNAALKQLGLGDLDATTGNDDFGLINRAVLIAWFNSLRVAAAAFVDGHADEATPATWAPADVKALIQTLGDPIMLAGTNEEMTDRRLHIGTTANKPVETLTTGNANHYSFFFNTETKSFTTYVADPADDTKLIASESSGTPATATYNGQQVQTWTPTPAFPHLTAADQFFDTGIDITGADHVIVWAREQSSNGRGKASFIDVAGQTDKAQPITIDSPYDTWHIVAYVDNKATGRVAVRNHNWASELTRIDVVHNAANGFVIPTATTSKAQIDVSVSGDSTTLNGGDANGKFLEGAGTNSLIVDLPAGQSINKTATETAINAIAGVNAVVTDAINGVIEFTVADGTGNVAFPITHVPAVGNTQVFEFTQDNSALGPTPSIEGWQFDMRSDHKQIRIYNNSGNKRMIHTSGGYRESSRNGDAMGTGNLGQRSQGMDPGTGYSVTSTDLAFNTGDATVDAKDGDVEYAVIDVWEFDGTDRLKFSKLHTLNVSCVIGSGFNNNNWRVEVVT